MQVYETSDDVKLLYKTNMLLITKKRIKNFFNHILLDPNFRSDTIVFEGNEWNQTRV